MLLIKLILPALLSSSLLLAKANADSKLPWTEVSDDFSALSNIDIKYTTIRNDSRKHAITKYSDELKIRNDFFWLNRELVDSANQTGSISGQVAFDGKMYQLWNSQGSLIMDPNPNPSILKSLAATPPVRLFGFIHPEDWRAVNGLQFLHDPNNWTTFASQISSSSHAVVDGIDVLRLSIKATDRNYEIDLLPNRNYFPSLWRTVKKDGSSVSVQCSSFKEFAIDGSKFVFPTLITEESNSSDGSMVLETKITVASITRLTTASNDNSEFHIDTASAYHFLNQNAH